MSSEQLTLVGTTLGVLHPLKPYSRTKRILDLMAREQGATNWELNKIAFRYSAYIHTLRKDGHQIETVYGHKGLVTYYLRDEVR